MLLGFGWAVVQASEEEFARSNLSDDELDALDEQWAHDNRRLHKACRAQLDTCSPWLKWQFSERLNNHCGLLQFYNSRNHANPEIFHLMTFLAEQSRGTYGVMYVHDDEGTDPKRFRLWRLLNGKVTEHAEPLFSPFTVPAAFGDKTL